MFFILWYTLRIEKKEVICIWNERCFYLSFFPELPCLEVTYKKALPSLESLISELRQEIPLRPKNLQKLVLYGIWWMVQVLFQ